MGWDTPASGISANSIPPNPADIYSAIFYILYSSPP